MFEIDTFCSIYLILEVEQSNLAEKFHMGKEGKKDGSFIKELWEGR